MWKYIPALSLIAMLNPGAAAAAQKSPPPAAEPTLRFEAALAKVDKKAANLFGEDKQKVLRQVAEAAVLSDYCAAINLDQKKFEEEFNALSVDGSKRTAAEQRDFDNKLAMYFGVYVGLLVAEGTDRRAEFCGLAENALKDQKPISRFWIATAKANPNVPKQ